MREPILQTPTSDKTSLKLVCGLPIASVWLFCPPNVDSTANTFDPPSLGSPSFATPAQPHKQETPSNQTRLFPWLPACQPINFVRILCRSPRSRQSQLDWPTDMRHVTVLVSADDRSCSHRRQPTHDIRSGPSMHATPLQCPSQLPTRHERTTSISKAGTHQLATHVLCGAFYQPRQPRKSLG